MKARSSLLFWLIAPASMALWLILVTPTHWLGIETGAVGTSLLLLTAWVGLWVSTRIPANKDSTVSPAEVRNAVALFFTLVIAAFLIVKSEAILHAETIADLRDVGRTFAMLVIGCAIFSSILRQRANSGVQEDERDRAVQAIAGNWAHGATCTLVIGIAVTLGLSPAARLAWATPIVIAHLLAFALVVANLVGCVVGAVHYRRAAA